MQRGSGGGAKSFGRKGTGGAALTGSGSDSAGGAEGGGRAQDCAHVAGILHAGKDDKKRSAAACAKKIVEGGGARLHERSNPLRMLGVREPLEQAIGGSQN